MIPATPRTVPRTPGTPLLRYGSAFAGVLLATLARAWLGRLLGDQYPFPTFFVASMVTAWYAGLGPALFSLGLGCLLGCYFFISPTNPWASTFLGISLYLFVGLTNAVFSESLRRARDAAEQAQQAMKTQAEQLRAANQEAEAINAQIRSQQGVLRREQELLQRIIDTIPVMIAMYEPSTQVLRLNPEFERRTGWSTEQARQVDLMAECYPDPEYREWVREYMQSLQPGWRDIRMTTREEQVIQTSWANIRLSDDTQIGIGIDISQRKWLEDELRRRVEALDEADRQKDQFIAVLAHELRNPLAPIRSAVELLMQRVERISYPVSDQYLALPDTKYGIRDPLSVIDRQARQMARLLDDLLDVSRISRGMIRLRRERLDLVSLVRDAAEDCRGLLEQAGLTLALELDEQPLWVEGDPTRLAQIVGNLLHNSAKFTDPGGAVIVALAADREFTTETRRHGDLPAERDEKEKQGPHSGPPSAPLPPPPLSVSPCLRVDSQEAMLTVRDTGIGIEPELLPHVFDSFTQADRSLERTRGGLGLGLALVKGLAELHGGEVEVTSQGIGHGARFTVRLPILDFGLSILDSSDQVRDEPPSDRLVSQNPKSNTQNPGATRLLIMEDNRDAADSLRALLELCGCTVEVAYSGPEGVRLARQCRPESVLCDLGLPGMSGYEVARQLRQDPELAQVRLIAVSGYGQEEDQRRAREAGFDRHLTKPIDFAALRQLLELPSGTGPD